MTRFFIVFKGGRRNEKNLFRSRPFPLCTCGILPLRARSLCAPVRPRATLFLPPYMNRRLRGLSAGMLELQALTEQVAELKAALADARSVRPLEDTRTEREKRLAADLYAHPELIPIEGTGREPCAFSPDERRPCAFHRKLYAAGIRAYAEDGYTAVNLLFPL